MNVTELKEKLLTSLDLWADARISEMVKENPALAIPSVYMKRASHNIIAKHKDSLGKSIDNATLFIADEDGNIDANTIFEDMMQMLENISNYEFDFGFINATFDKSEIKLIVAYVLQHLHHIFKYCVCIYVSVFICDE